MASMLRNDNDFSPGSKGTPQPRVMGVLNVTPDSFYDGGRHHTVAAAVKHAEQLVQQGVDIIDVGGESTRPSAEPVTLAQELDRVIPVIAAIKQFKVPISVDTSRPEVMRAALDAGASMVNDVRALQLPGAIEVVAEYQVPVCLMHMQGSPQTMQQQPHYVDVVQEIGQFFQARIEICAAAGIKREHIVLDPGFGFGKTPAHNLTLLNNLNKYSQFKLPILVGLSRKSFIGYLLNQPNAADCLPGSIALAVMAAVNGADIIRCHDVQATREAIHVAMAVCHADTTCNVVQGGII